jgi:hypothetical protein
MTDEDYSGLRDQRDDRLETVGLTLSGIGIAAAILILATVIGFLVVMNWAFGLIDRP